MQPHGPLAAEVEPTDGDNLALAILRRAITVPAAFVAFALVSRFFVWLLAACLAVDVLGAIGWRRPWMATRLAFFLWVYLAGETVAIVLLAMAWLFAGLGARARQQRLSRWVKVLEIGWSNVLFRAVCTLFRLSFQVECEPLAPGPLVIFAHHASMVDTLLPLVIITTRFGLLLRFVFKRELLLDPAIDLAGHLVPNCFVARGSSHSEREIARTGSLGEGLDADEGVLIYPEGTRFSEAKRLRKVEHLRQAHPHLYERAAAFRYVLPPSLGGPIAILNSAPSADVALLAHRGLEGFARVADIWAGAMVGRGVHVYLRRVPRSEVPLDDAGRIDWLFTQWKAIDDWIAHRREHP